MHSRTQARRRPRIAFSVLAAVAVVASSLTATAAFADDGITPPTDLAISGHLTVGSTISITGGAWAPAGTAVAVAWSAGGTPITEPDGQGDDLDLTIAPDLVGKTISADVTGSADGYSPVTEHVDATAAVAPGTFSSTPTPTLPETVKVGDTVTVVTGAWSPAAAFSYQWIVDGQPVGTDADSYEIQPSDMGKPLAVAVTGSADGYTSVTVDSNGVKIDGQPNQPTKAPRIVGSVRVGSKLTVDLGTWAPQSVLSSFWTVGGETVARGTTFTPSAAQRGKVVTVTVIAVAPGLEGTASVSATIGYGVFSAPKPKISGDARTGATMTAKPGTWAPSATFSYQWLRNGKAIKGTTHTKYKAGNADMGKKLSVKVTGKRTAYTTKSVTSASTAKVVKPFGKTTAPTITGTTRVNSTLTAHHSSWSPKPSSYSYQWKRNGVAIKGATRSTHKLTASDYGKKITVTLTGKHGGYWTTGRTSKATHAIAGPAPVVTKDSLAGYRVGKQIKAGTYYANAPVGCLWARLDKHGDVLGAGMAYDRGRQIVTIKASDYAFGTYGCGSWTPLLKLKTPATSAGDGMQAVGITMQAGHYVTTAGVPEDCGAGILTGFGGTDQEIIDGRITVDPDSYKADVRLTSADKGFVSYGCGTWKRVGD